MTGKAFEEAQKRFVSSVVHKSEKCVYMSPLSASTPIMCGQVFLLWLRLSFSVFPFLILVCKLPVDILL